MEIKAATWPKGSSREPSKEVMTALKTSLDKADRDGSKITNAPAFAVEVPDDATARKLEQEIRLAGSRLGCGVGVTRSAGTSGKVKVTFRAQTKRQRNR